MICLSLSIIILTLFLSLLLFLVQTFPGISLVLLTQPYSSNAVFVPLQAPYPPAQSISHPSLSLHYSTRDLDKLSVMANLQALLEVASDIMNSNNDSAFSVCLRSSRSSLFLQRVDTASTGSLVLIVVFKNNSNSESSLCSKLIDKTAALVRNLILTASVV
jgi:hypothetical protein